MIHICANTKCKNFDLKAIGNKYPMSTYCSIKCKYQDERYTEHNETYGD